MICSARRLPSPTETVIDIVSVARLVRLLQQDDVWPIMEVRQWFLAKTGKSRISDLMTCPFCLGMWFGGLVVVLRLRFPQQWPLIARVLAGSEMAGHLAGLSD